MGPRPADGLRAGVALALLAGLLGACGGGGRTGPPVQPAPRVNLSGLVLNSAGAPEPGAQVLVGQSPTTTDASGRFSYQSLPAGRYAFSVQGRDGTFRSQHLDIGPGDLDDTFRLPGPSQVVAASPGLNTSDAPLGASIVLDFGGAAPPGETEARFEFSPDIGPVLRTADSGNLILTPRRQLPAGQVLTLDMLPQVAGAGFMRLRFRTAATDTSPPVLVATIPAAGETDFPINLAVRLEFNEALGEDLSDLFVAIDPPTDVTARVSGSALLILPDEGWQRDTGHTIRLAGVADRLGNVQAAEIQLGFTTGSRAAPVRNIQPEWSRARGEIVFAGNRTGEFSIYSIEPDGSALTRLTFGLDDELHPSLSADGALLAWQSRGDGGDWDIFVGERTDTSGARAVTPPGVNDTAPVFARTLSRSIFFVSDRFAPSTRILRMGPDGSSVAVLGESGHQLSPRPHPQIDNQLLFVSHFGTGRDIFSMSVSVIDGSVTILPVTDQRLSDEYDPDWGPDASFLAYVSNAGGSTELWIAGFGAPQGRQVTSLGGISSPSPAPTAGDNRCVVSLEYPDRRADLVIVDTTSGAIVINLTTEGSD